MNRILLVIVFCFLGLSACGPSQEEIQATVQVSIAQTEVAKPTATVTRMPTATPAPTATATNTPSPSPTPDIRLIDIDPRKLLLQKEDLPASGRYYLPGAGWTSPHTNSEIVSGWTVEEGRAYLAATGRVHGWWVVYKRGANGAVMPEEVYNNIVLYSSIDGAQLVVTEYGERGLFENGFREIDDPQIGDLSSAFQKSETNSSGATRVWLRINFSYRNIYHAVEIWGWEKDVSMNFAVDVANQLLEDLEQVSLSDSVQFTP